MRFFDFGLVWRFVAVSCFDIESSLKIEPADLSEYRTLDVDKSDAEWGRIFGTLPFAQSSLIRFLSNLFSGLFSCQRLLHAALLARL
jgi:hypothetical protein